MKHYIIQVKAPKDSSTDVKKNFFHGKKNCSVRTYVGFEQGHPNKKFMVKYALAEIDETTKRTAFAVLYQKVMGVWTWISTNDGHSLICLVDGTEEKEPNSNIRFAPQWVNQ